DENSDVRTEAVRQINSGWKHQPEILELLKQKLVSDENSDVRTEAVRQINSGWKHQPEILELLKQKLVSDENSDVRTEAVRQIASSWKYQPGIFELFDHAALNDPFQNEDEFSDNPRQTALEVIVEQYPEHPQTLPLLKDRAENDPDTQLQEWAKETLQQLENSYYKYLS
ncbi:MAG: HEAT repeat domain-containing protein, partial [Trichodesmium sp. MAG_R01]|nr:HEAT repeat domain-containing protein [Trichodesmium sp. MAG_R01]